jgi:sulfite reductase (NADPH) hemoprotein beta-component
MPTVDLEPSRPRASFSEQADADEFLATLERFERGEIGADAWRAFRLLRGTYEQRQEGDLHMLRVKVPEGALTAPQLEAIAEVADRHSRGFGHVTTRQNVQLHFVARAGAAAAIARLGEAGITTREACGNSLRNVTACALAGVSPDERFDVTPYAEALTRHFLRHPLATSLPRKFKIAFEGCATDHAATPIHDLGFRAVLDAQGRRGFRLAAGGGTSTVPVSARVLLDFLPAGELLEAAEAVVRVFHSRGDREHRERNRLKFLVRQLGWDGFVEAVRAEREAVRADGGRPLPFDPERPPVEEAPSWARPPPPSPAALAASVRAAPPRGPGIVPAPAPASELAAWRRSNVRPQKQAGFVAASVTLPLGDVTAAQLRALAALARSYGDGQVRLSDDQDLLLRWVREEDVPALHAGLVAAGLGLDGAHGLADVTSCPGAETCRLAVTQSRGLGRVLGDHLRATPRLRELAPDLAVKVSGCPNGCGRHHVAGIGLQGSARKVDGRAVPQYFVLLGGAIGEDGARFGRLAAKIPARRVPEAVTRLLDLYARERREGEVATAFFGRVDLAAAKAALAGLGELSGADARPEDFVDLAEEGAPAPGSPEGECAA